MPTRFGVERKPNVCGCRQVVRHELPKLAFAGSSPVTRSIDNFPAAATLPAVLETDLDRDENREVSPVTRSIDNYGSLMAAVFVARLSIQGGPHESEQSHIRHVHLRS